MADTSASGGTPAPTQTQGTPAAPAPPAPPQTNAAPEASQSHADGTAAGTHPNPQDPTSASAEGRTAPQLDDASEPVDLEGWRRYTRRLSRENADRRKELQSVTAERDTAVAELTHLKTQALRSRVAADVGLRAELADRIRGDTEAQMREDAERLREMTDPVGQVGARTGSNSGSAGGGKPDMDTLLRSARRSRTG